MSPVNPQITDAVTQLSLHAAGTVTNLTKLINELTSLSSDTPIPTLTETIREFQGLTAEDKRNIMMMSRDPSTAMLMTETLLRSKNS